MIGLRGEWPLSRAFTADITGNLSDKVVVVQVEKSFLEIDLEA